MTISDIRKLQRPNDSQAARWIDAEVKAVRSEIYALCNEQNLFEVITNRRQVLYQYVVLRRTLQAEASAFLFDAEAAEFSFTDGLLDYDDGLDVLANLFTPEKSLVSKKPLKTIRDYQWYADWFNVSQDELDVHAIKSVSPAAALARIGVSNADQLTPRFWEILVNERSPERIMSTYVNSIQSESGIAPSLPKVLEISRDPWDEIYGGIKTVRFELSGYPQTLEIDHGSQTVKHFANGTATASFKYDGKEELTNRTLISTKATAPEAITLARRNGNHYVVFKLKQLNHEFLATISPTR